MSDGFPDHYSSMYQNNLEVTIAGLRQENAELKAQKEIDRQEIERLKQALQSIAGENYDDDDDYENICCRFDEIKRFARETIKP